MVKTRKNYRYRRFPRYKKISGQNLRMKFDKGLQITFPQTSGNIIYDLRNTQVLSVRDIFEEQISDFSKYFGYMKIYGVTIEVTPVKSTASVFPSCYTGFIYNDVGTAPSIDVARNAEFSLTLPCFGAQTVRKFWRFPGIWQNRDSEVIGYFWIQNNENATMATGPRWEVRYSIYVKLRMLQY